MRKSKQKNRGGLRTQDFSKRAEEDKPLITVITVVYNGEKFLEETIQSVINQTYDNVEYIIVDGGSTDGTLDIIHKYEHAIDYWVSEPDQGIYDAMNKGISLATGDWINFMNAGDIFYQDTTISEIFSGTIASNTTFLYGDVSVDYGDCEIIKTASNLKQIHKCMVFSHQSLFVRTDYLECNPFDLTYKSAADYNLIYKAYIHNAGFMYIDKVISKVIAGGVSDTQRLRSIRESERVVLSNCKKNKLLRRLYFLCMCAWLILKSKIKKTLPSALIKYIRLRK